MQTGVLQGGGSRQALPGSVYDLALADERQPDMSERSQVPAAAQRSVLPHHGGDALVEQRHQPEHQVGPNARVAHGQGRGP